ncbi:MAG: outer membrane protein assembly factor BamD [Bacteroidaceae bacterium]|jgi:outer membrane protein assembly factor BamD|nr:outer membrane protein assembly factor BamD [Bacteroidaceae bacterium]
MKRNFILIPLLAIALGSCSKWTAIQNTRDYEYKYEVAKAYYMEGKYSQASVYFAEVLAFMKGTVNAEESLYLAAMSNFMNKDYDAASQYFRKYYQVYPKGLYVEYARYYCGLALYNMTPDPRLDQQSTYEAIKEFQDFLDYYPYTSIKESTLEMIYKLQDKLVEKEYLSAKLYYDLGSYTMNCAYGGSNYEACVVTAQNALRDFPFASADRREELSIMILRSRFHLAEQSVDSKRVNRYRDCIDEYYAFTNDFPESKYIKEAAKIMEKSTAYVNKHASKDELVD